MRCDPRQAQHQSSNLFVSHLFRVSWTTNHIIFKGRIPIIWVPSNEDRLLPWATYISWFLTWIVKSQCGLIDPVSKGSIHCTTLHCWSPSGSLEGGSLFQISMESWWDAHDMDRRIRNWLKHLRNFYPSWHETAADWNSIIAQKQGTFLFCKIVMPEHKSCTPLSSRLCDTHAACRQQSHLQHLWMKWTVSRVLAKGRLFRAERAGWFWNLLKQ